MRGKGVGEKKKKLLTLKIKQKLSPSIISLSGN